MPEYFWMVAGMAVYAAVMMTGLWKIDFTAEEMAYDAAVTF